VPKVPRRAKGPARTRRGGHRIWRKLLAVLVCIVLVVVLAGVGYGWYAWEQVPVAKGLAELPPVEKVESILLVGSDTREELGDADRFGGKAVGGQRADSITLLVLPPGHAQATALSLPRDLRVDVPGRGVGKLNGAFNGGAAGMVQAVQAATGITVNHYLEINFDGFKDLSTAVGGVQVCTDHPVRDKFSDLDLPNPGCQKLSGDQALAWVRSRHQEELVDGKWRQDPRGDLGRIERQQAFLTTMMGSLASVSALVHLPQLAGAAEKAFKRDAGFSYWHLLHLSLRFFPSMKDKLVFRTLPVVPKDIGGISFVVLEQPQATELLAQLKSGQVPPPPAG